MQVQFTVGDEELATVLLGRLLEARLIACGQVMGPITSRYWWEGVLEQATEWLCLGKTTPDNVGAVTSVIREGHPDEIPEVIALPVVAGLDSYLAWVRAEAIGGPGGGL